MGPLNLLKSHDSNCVKNMPTFKSLFSENSMRAHDSQNDIIRDWNMRVSNNDRTFILAELFRKLYLT